MKKALIALVLAGGIGAIAYASLSNNSRNKQAIEKKTEKKEKKHECKRTCLFS
ncbi:MAG TPA: hypothetical protein VFI06_07210 [Chitinophagaceae bacterium]|nr:hypothetical protein [Chitinophagaceae bacterium]